ncbi:MAG TPA: nickel-binding protein [Candidatus Limnocylindria bacterium]|nr:nickel-binding protein [Candidatus Limnocylindria bacterium]
MTANAKRRFFLVERYIPSISSSSVESAARRLAETTDDSAHHLMTLLVAGEETCLSVFEASDAHAVERANERAGFELDRIVEVALFPEAPVGEGPLAGEGC